MTSRGDASDLDGANESSSPAATSIGIGVALVMVGLLITAVTYGRASAAGGGMYIIAYGPIVAGVISIFKGLFRMR